MKTTILVTTDFTQSSRNALTYACGLADGHNAHIVLLNVYTIPITYTSEGVALAAISDSLGDAEERLADEVTYIKGKYPDLDIETKAVVGGFIDSLQEQIATLKPRMIVMGALSEYSDLWTWDSQILDALTGLSVPVLIVPQHIEYKAVSNIAFACDYRNFCMPAHIDFIKLLMDYTHAHLHVVHISRSKPLNEEVKNKNQAVLNDMLHDKAPQFYEIEDQNVIDAIAHFVKEHQIDFLIVVPHEHGVWYNIFHQSHTKQLARLNNIPVLALHD